MNIIIYIDFEKIHIHTGGGGDLERGRVASAGYLFAFYCNNHNLYTCTRVWTNKFIYSNLDKVQNILTIVI